MRSHNSSRSFPDRSASVQLFECFVMIIRVKHKLVIAVDYAFFSPVYRLVGYTLGVVTYVAFMIIAALFFRKQSFIVSEIISADALARADDIQIAFTGHPSGRLGFLFRNKIGRELTVGVDIQRHVLFIGICAFFRYGQLFAGIPV